MPRKAVTHTSIDRDSRSGPFPHWPLGQLTLQRPAIDAEDAGGRRDIATAFGEHALDVLPVLSPQR